MRDKSLKSQKMFRIPCPSNEVLHKNFESMSHMAINQKIQKKHVIYYDEMTTHPIQELDNLYEELNITGKAPADGSSMDDSVATIDNTGKVTAVSVGLAIMQAELDGNTYIIYVRVR